MKRYTQLAALVALIALGVGASAAVAGTHPDNRATHGPGAVALDEPTSVVRPDDRTWRGVGPAPTSLTAPEYGLRPDDRANHGVGALGGSPIDVVRPDDRAWRGVGPEPTIVPTTSVGTTTDGFDWVDASIGASGALGLALLLAGASALVARRHRVGALT